MGIYIMPHWLICIEKNFWQLRLDRQAGSVILILIIFKEKRGKKERYWEGMGKRIKNIVQFRNTAYRLIGTF